MSEFKREERFIVIKRKNLRPVDERELHTWLQQNEIPTCECVVVESDWPEYEQVWRMIEARVTGATPSEDGRVIDTSAWEACNPGCDSEFNGEKGRHCVCEPAKAAMTAQQIHTINSETADVVGYTTAGMLRISKDLPLTGRIGAKCKQDERWNVPLMTVAQHSRIVAAKDSEIARLGSQLSDAHRKVVQLEGQCVRLAQPARQVGGGEREEFEAWLSSLKFDYCLHRDLSDSYTVEWVSDMWRGWQARAALAPAAVVMPERKGSLDHRGDWIGSGLDMEWNAALDEVARLNRRAIPEGLIEASRRAADILGSQGFAAWDQLAAELRALLGKEGAR